MTVPYGRTNVSIPAKGTNIEALLPDKFTIETMVKSYSPDEVGFVMESGIELEYIDGVRNSGLTAVDAYCMTPEQFEAYKKEQGWDE